jgi:hypothetical protein
MCGGATADIGVDTAYFGDTSSVSLKVNYGGPHLGFNRENTAEGYKGPIRVGNVTLEGGMPEERAVQLLRSSQDVSFKEVHLTGENRYFVADAANPAIMWQVMFEESKLRSAVTSWGLSPSDQLARAPFATAVFEDLNDLKGSGGCTVETALANPSLHDSPTGIASPTNPSDSLSVIKHVNISCGKTQVNISIGTAASGNYSSVDITESIFAK